MSTDYIPRDRIPFDKIKGLNTHYIRETQAPDTTEDKACLTDENGENYLWALKARNGGTVFSRYARNDVEVMIQELERMFETEIVSEHGEDYYDLIEDQYREDFITLQFPTHENPGPWEQIYAVQLTPETFPDVISTMESIFGEIPKEGGD